MFLYMLLSIATAEAGDYLCKLENEVTKECLTSETLVSFVHSPNQLAVDKRNVLYFSFDSGKGDYTTATYTMSTKKLTVLTGIKDAFAIASDPDSLITYFGGSHGIYRYEPTKKKLQRLSLKNLDIWWLFIKKAIYFVKFPSLNAYVYLDKNLTSVPALTSVVHQYVFDFEDNIFFINSSGLYGVPNKSHQIIILREQPRFLCMATDRLGNVYLCGEEGIYVISKIIQKVKKVVNIPGVLGLAFDIDNNIVYSDSQEIVRLKPDKNHESANNID